MTKVTIFESVILNDQSLLYFLHPKLRYEPNYQLNIVFKHIVQVISRWIVERIKILCKACGSVVKC